MPTNAQLAVEIEAENKVNALIKDYAPAMFANAKALEGRPVFKADGSLRKDAQAVLDIPTPPERHDMIFLSRGGYSLAFTFKTSAWAKNEREHMSDHCAYAQTTVYIGDMENGVLGPVKEFQEEAYKSDYTLEEVLALRAICETARRVYEEARSACNPFGEGR